jgi:Family of unknown function (DUF5522)
MRATRDGGRSEDGRDGGRDDRRIQHGLSDDEHRARPEAVADRPLSQPHPDRFSQRNPAYEQAIRAHDEALSLGRDTYIDPTTGFVVLTAAYLAQRGYCCGSGCRHCPYIR